MSSNLFHLTGTESEISCQIFPPLQVPEDSVIGLTKMQVFNSLANVDSTCNVFCYSENKEKWEDIIIPIGNYDIYDIENHLKAILGKDAISIKPNTNTLKCTFYCKYNVRFEGNTIGKLFGFYNEEYSAGQYIESSKPLTISDVNTIQVELSIANGSYQNGVQSSCIYKCFVTVPPGSMIVEIPNNVIYFSINTDEIDSLNVKLTDEHHKLLDFRGEEISIELHLKNVAI